MAISKANEVNTYTCGPRSHFPGDEITYTDGVWIVVDQNDNRKTARGVDSTSAGVLMVHLVDDPSDSYYPLSVQIGRTSAVFDQVIESGTTLTEADAYILF